MRRFHLLSVAMVVIGIALMLLGSQIASGEMWILAGILLTVAGVIKVAVIGLWRLVAGFGDTIPPRPSAKR